MSLPVASLSSQPLSAQLTISGEDRSAFSLSKQRIDLPPRGSVEAELQMAPHRPGALAATLELALCDGCPSASVALYGIGLYSALVPRPGRLDFGSVPPGSSSSQVVSIVNLGDAPGRLSSASLHPAGDFRFDSTSLPALVQAGSSLDVRVTFAPTDLGPRESALRFVGGEAASSSKCRCPAEERARSCRSARERSTSGRSPSGRRRRGSSSSARRPAPAR